MTDTTTLVSRANGANGDPANGDSEAGGISADGRRVVFVSSATNLAGKSCTEYYVRDLVTNQTTYVGPTPENCTGVANIDDNRRGYIGDALISGDGTKVAFATYNNIDPTDTAVGSLDVYEEDLATKAITLVDRGDGSGGAVANSGQTNVTGINTDGSRVVFETASNNVDPDATAGMEEVFVRDVSANHTYLVSRASAGGAVENHAYGGGISGNGNRVVFTTYASNVTPDAPYGDGVFVRDIAAGTTMLASRAAGAAGIQANGSGDLLPPSISTDGTRVTFVTDAGNLGFAANGNEVYVRDLSGGTTTLVSHQAGDPNTVADYPSQHATISGNGDCVA